MNRTVTITLNPEENAKLNAAAAFAAHGAENEIQRECLEAAFAYEQVLALNNGKKTRASRTWKMIRNHGIIGAVECIFTRKKESSGYRALVEMGLDYYAFESVVLRHPNEFSIRAAQCSLAPIGTAL